MKMKREASVPHPAPPPLLIVLSGQSGVGKDAVLKGLKESGQPLEFMVTMTTRPPRPGEADGVDYHFVSMEKYLELRDSGQLLESAEVYGNYYGPPRQPVKTAFSGLGPFTPEPQGSPETRGTSVSTACAGPVTASQPSDREARMRRAPAARRARPKIRGHGAMLLLPS